MSKNYGPKGFDKALEKALVGFNETKIFVTHTRSETVVKYIDGDKLFGIKIYRSDWDLELWLPHFQHYLDTGIFDTNAYWVEYSSVNVDGEIISTYDAEVHAMPMVLKDKTWSIHSSEMSEFMKVERAAKGDIGFKHVARPLGEAE